MPTRGGRRSSKTNVSLSLAGGRKVCCKYVRVEPDPMVLIQRFINGGTLFRSDFDLIIKEVLNSDDVYTLSMELFNEGINEISDTGHVSYFDTGIFTIYSNSLAESTLENILVYSRIGFALILHYIVFLSVTLAYFPGSPPNPDISVFLTTHFQESYQSKLIDTINSLKNFNYNSSQVQPMGGNVELFALGVGQNSINSGALVWRQLLELTQGNNPRDSFFVMMFGSSSEDFSASRFLFLYINRVLVDGVRLSEGLNFGWE